MVCLYIHIHTHTYYYYYHDYHYLLLLSLLFYIAYIICIYHAWILWGTAIASVCQHFWARNTQVFGSINTLHILHHSHWKDPIISTSTHRHLGDCVASKVHEILDCRHHSLAVVHMCLGGNMWSIARILVNRSSSQVRKIKDVSNMFDLKRFETAQEQWPRRKMVIARYCKSFAAGNSQRRAWQTIQNHNHPMTYQILPDIGGKNM